MRTSTLSTSALASEGRGLWFSRLGLKVYDSGVWGLGSALWFSALGRLS